MKIAFQNENVTLWHGDAREWSGKADAVVVDPFYGVDGGRGGDSRKYAKAAYEGPFDDTPETVAKVCVPVVARWVEAGVPMAVTPGIRCLHLYPTPVDMGCFWTPAACTHGPWGMTTFQPILYYGKDWRAGKGPMPSGKQLTERAEKNGHPCPKPIKAWTWLVDKVTPKGATVLDPFCGSGTTLIAALETGRKTIGIEIDERWVEVARRRLERWHVQGRLDFCTANTRIADTGGAKPEGRT